MAETTSSIHSSSDVTWPRLQLRLITLWCWRRAAVRRRCC